MPVIKPIPFTIFDVNNPEHVAEVIKVKNGGMRNPNLKFDFPPPCTNGVDYALKLMAEAWGRHMAQQHPEVFPEQNSTIDAATASGDNIRKLPVIGSKSKPLQETPSRSLPPGSTVG